MKKWLIWILVFSLMLNIAAIAEGELDVAQFQTPFDLTLEEFQDSLLHQKEVVSINTITWNQSVELEDGYSRQDVLIDDYPPVSVYTNPEGYICAITSSVSASPLDESYNEVVANSGIAFLYSVISMNTVGLDASAIGVKGVIIASTFTEAMSDLEESNFDVDNLLTDGITISKAFLDNFLTLLMRIEITGADAVVSVSYIYTPESYQIT